MLPKKKFETLDGLKGVCITIIVLFHTMEASYFGTGAVLSIIQNYGGYFGNYTFFMISGFLIAYNYNYQEKAEGCFPKFGTYLKKRILKLYPLYFLTNLVELFIAIYHNGIIAFNIKDFVLIMLMQVGGTLEDLSPYNSPTWFVCNLMVCYVVYYFIIYMSKNKTEYSVFIVLAVIIGYMFQSRDWIFPYRNCSEGLINFFIGCNLSGLYLKIKDERKIKIIMIGSATVLCLLGLFAYTEGLDTISGDVRITFSGIVCPTLLFWTLKSNICKMALNFKPINVIGRISTSIFFLHVVLDDIVKISGFYKSDVVPYGVQYIIYVLALLISSAICYYFVEKKLAGKIRTMFL